MKNIYLKYTLLSVAISSSLLFTACGHKHTFADATCTTPKTCTECNEIEGDALGHTWLDATCENPMTCSVCNLTEGDVLEHSWLEATTEAPKTCEFCGHSVVLEDTSIKESNSGVDSTGVNITLTEADGDYKEPTAPSGTTNTEYSQYSAQTQTAIANAKSMYEQGLFTKEEYEELVQGVISVDPSNQSSSSSSSRRHGYHRQRQ